MNALHFQNPILISATLDAQRRLQLPKSLDLCVPLVLIEFDSAGEIRLGFSNTASVQEMRSEGMAPTVLRECNSLRPLIPNDACVRHSLAPSSKVWLLTMERWISIWSEAGWNTEFDATELATCRIPDDHKDAYETGLAENRTSPS